MSEIGRMWLGLGNQESSPAFQSSVPDSLTSGKWLDFISFCGGKWGEWHFVSNLLRRVASVNLHQVFAVAEMDKWGNHVAIDTVLREIKSGFCCWFVFFPQTTLRGYYSVFAGSFLLGQRVRWWWPNRLKGPKSRTIWPQCLPSVQRGWNLEPWVKRKIVSSMW